ncbi:hypothetical protein HZB07_07305 [Candidatus Saganbacteria bacterium]|nr:hypothetical protein [Candidatus Saganbacteria bacterium]
MMKLQDNFYKIIIIVSLLIFWGYLLYPLISEVNIRPDFSEILVMGQFTAKLIKYLQIFLIALAGLLAAIVIIKMGDLYFTRLRLAGEKKRIAEQVKEYRQAHKDISSFTDVITEPFDVAKL